MASSKNIYAGNWRAATMFASGVWRGSFPTIARIGERAVLVGVSKERMTLTGVSAERMTLTGVSAERVTIEGAD